MKRYTIAGMILSFLLGALIVIYQAGAPLTLFRHAAHLALMPMRPLLHVLRFPRRY
jgi:hypothetical protein